MTKEKILTREECQEIVAKIKTEMPDFWEKVVRISGGMIDLRLDDEFTARDVKRLSYEIRDAIKATKPDILEYKAYNINSEEISSLSYAKSVLISLALDDWKELYSND